MKALILITVLILGFVNSSFAQQDDTEFNTWIGSEPKELPTLLTQFKQSCERRYIPKIEKYKKPYDLAERYTRDHCKCIERFFKAKDDPMFVQVVNLDLRDALRSLPKLPPELEIYLDTFRMVQMDCEKNPNHVSQAEVEARLDREQAAAEKASKNKMRKGDRSKPRLPYRPQKQSPEEPGARR